MLKITKVLLSLLLLLTMLAACSDDNSNMVPMYYGGGSNATDSNAAGSNETNDREETVDFTEEEDNGGVPVAKQKEDLIKHEEIQNCYSSAFVPVDEYGLVRYDTTREQLNKEDKEHIIYSDVEIQNQYFNIILSVKQEYNYYDKGGWFLDNLTVESQQVSVVGPADVSMIAEALKNEYMKDDGIKLYSAYQGEGYRLCNGIALSGVHGELVENGSTMIAHLDFESKVLQVKGYFTLDFTQEKGWSLQEDEEYSNGEKVMTIESYTSNYEMATGTFRLVDLIYNTTKKWVVLEISDNSIRYTLDGVEFTSKFDPLRGEFSFIYEIIEEGTNTTTKSYGDFTYYPDKNEWIEDGYNGRINQRVIRE